MKIKLHKNRWENLIFLNWLLLIPLLFLFMPGAGWIIIAAPVWLIPIVLIIPVVVFSDSFLLFRHILKKQRRHKWSISLVLPILVLVFLLFIAFYSSYYAVGYVNASIDRVKEGIKAQQDDAKYEKEEGITLKEGIDLIKKCQVKSFSEDTLNTIPSHINYELKSGENKHTNLITGEDYDSGYYSGAIAQERSFKSAVHDAEKDCGVIEDDSF